MWNRMRQLLRRVVWFAFTSLALLLVGFTLAVWWEHRIALVLMCGAGAVTCAVLAAREER